MAFNQCLYLCFCQAQCLDSENIAVSNAENVPAQTEVIVKRETDESTNNFKEV